MVLTKKLKESKQPFIGKNISSAEEPQTSAAVDTSSGMSSAAVGTSSGASSAAIGTSSGASASEKSGESVNNEQKERYESGKTAAINKERTDLLKGIEAAEDAYFYNNSVSLSEYRYNSSDDDIGSSDDEGEMWPSNYNGNDRRMALDPLIIKRTLYTEESMATPGAPPPSPSSGIIGTILRNTDDGCIPGTFWRNTDDGPSTFNVGRQSTSSIERAGITGEQLRHYRDFLSFTRRHGIRVEPAERSFEHSFGDTDGNSINFDSPPSTSDTRY